MPSDERSHPAATFSTTVERNGLVLLLLLNETNRFSGSITFRMDSGEAVVFFRDGNVVHAEAGAATGEEAFFRILRSPRVEYTLDPEAPAPRLTIQRGLDVLLADAQQPGAGRPASGEASTPLRGARPRVEGAPVFEGTRGASGAVHAPPRAPIAASAPQAPRRDPTPSSGMRASRGPPRDATRSSGTAATEPPPRKPTPAGVPRPAPEPPGESRWGRQQRWFLLASAAGAALAFAAIGGFAIARRVAAPVPAAAPSAPRIVLRLGGAKAVAEELAPALAEAYLRSLRLDDIHLAREDTYRSTARGTKDGATWAITVRGVNTPQAFDDLASDAIDIAMTGRRIKPEWQQKAAALGNLASPGAEHVVGISGIAVIVNMANAVPQLDSRQLAAIFSGSATDWAAIARPGESGAPARPIHVYATADDMGLTDLFRTLVLGNLPYAESARRVSALQDMNDAVARDPDGIGFVTLPFIRGTRAVPVSDGDDAPLVPTAFTVATEDYLLSHRLYFYAPPASKNPHVAKFLQFALGTEGQAVVRRSGYVELSVAAERREARSQAPAKYVRLTTGARRLTSTFRFEVNASNFDARALADLDRVIRYLVDNRVDGGAVRILGFADSQGNPAYNIKLSQARAELVANAFVQRGVTGTSVHGFGSEMPVASNATDEGRRRNRRVEVWVTE